MADAMTFADMKGSIVSYTVIHIATPEFVDEAPFGLAIIETQDGERLLVRIPGVGADDLSIGAAVVYDRGDDQGPVFRLQ